MFSSPKYQRKRSINILTLGCSKNIYDSETLATILYKNNAKIQFIDNAAEAKGDVIIINTCGFILDAKEESIASILDAIEAKKTGNVNKIFAIGCLVERYKKELTDEMADEVDGFFGVNEMEKIIDSLGFEHNKQLHGERLLSTPSHFAFLKISEGCDRSCAFCAIPLMRGKHISLPFEKILEQARYLYSINVKELILIAQDTTYYGIDLYGRQRLPELLEELAKIGFDWVRLHYAYPSSFPMQILDIMNNYPNITHYLDIPFQHISDKMLKIMRRGHNRKDIYHIINTFRKHIPDLAIRTAFIVGHPGEEETDFKELLNFVKEIEFDRLGVFTYSHEDNTYAWKYYKDEIDENTKQQRAAEIMTLQQSISLKKNQQKIGTIQHVLIDRREGNYFVGRTQYDSPDIDNEVLIKPHKDIKIGQFYNVKIYDALEFDLFGILNE